MILDKFEELLNFSVNKIDIKNFIVGANEVKAFEEAVSILDIDIISSGCSKNSFVGELDKYEKVIQASRLSAVAKADVNRSFWKKFVKYKELYEQAELTFQSRTQKKDELIFEIEIIDLFHESGRDIPTYSEIEERLRLIEKLEKDINNLEEKSEIIPREVLDKFNAIKKNYEKCNKTWAINFTGKGERKYDNGIYYVGDFVNGQAEGIGILLYPKTSYDRYSYEGAFRNNSFCGIGKLVYINGDIYEGYFKDNYPEGKGIITYHTGDVYEGDVSKGKRNGYGKLIGEEAYEGHWKQDVKAPTASEAAYWDGRKTFEQALNCMNSQARAAQLQTARRLFNKSNNFLDTTVYISKCESEIEKIYKSERVAAMQIMWGKIKVIILQVFLIACAVTAEFLISMWLGKIGHIWYTMWSTFAISGIYFAVSNRVHDNHVSWIAISTLLLIGMNITPICLYAAFYWGIVFLVIFNTAIIVALSIIIKKVDYFQELICSVKVIPTLLLFGVSLAAYILSSEVTKYFYQTSNMWHALWIAPVILIVYSIIYTLLEKWVGPFGFFAADGDGYFYLIAIAIVIFLRVAIAVGSFGFSVGIFFFCILLLAASAIAYFLSIGFYYTFHD